MARLTAAEEKNLIQIAQSTAKGSEERNTALQKLIEDQAVTIKRILNKDYWSAACEYDLQQEALMSLMEAVDNFDLNSNNRLSTYATYWIHKRISDYFHENTAIVIIPGHVRRNISKMKKERAVQQQLHNEDISVQKLAELTGLRETSIKAAMIADQFTFISAKPTDCDECNGEQDVPITDTIADDKPTPEEIYFDIRRKELVRSVLTNSSIDNTAQEVIKRRFGFYNDTEQSIEEIATQLNLKPQAVMQQFDRAKSELFWDFFRAGIS